MIRTKLSISFDQAIDLFSSDCYLTVNKKIIRKYGPELAVYICNLTDRFLYLKSAEKINGNWFYYTYKQQEKETGLSEYKIRKCKLFLLEKNILKTKFKGLPRKEWYSINFPLLLSSLSTSLKSSPEKTNAIALKRPTQLPLKDQRNNINNKPINNKHIYNKYISCEYFSIFWKNYPKKVDKGKCLTIWNKLCKNKDKPTKLEIEQALKNQKETERWQDRQFIPHPSTWLNQKRWLDDPNEMNVFKINNNKDNDNYEIDDQIPESVKNLYQ